MPPQQTAAKMAALQNGRFHPIPRLPADRLISYFDKLVKITGTLFAIVIAAASILLFKDHADIQGQLNASREAATQEIAAIKATAGGPFLRFLQGWVFSVGSVGDRVEFYEALARRWGHH